MPDWENSMASRAYCSISPFPPTRASLPKSAVPKQLALLARGIRSLLCAGIGGHILSGWKHDISYSCGNDARYKQKKYACIYLPSFCRPFSFVTLMKRFCNSAEAGYLCQNTSGNALLNWKSSPLKSLVSRQQTATGTSCRPRAPCCHFP